MKPEIPIYVRVGREQPEILVGHVDVGGVDSAGAIQGTIEVLTGVVNEMLRQLEQQNPRPQRPALDWRDVPIATSPCAVDGWWDIGYDEVAGKLVWVHADPVVHVQNWLFDTDSRGAAMFLDRYEVYERCLDEPNSRLHARREGG